jgi:hypothetical protein
VKEFALRRMGVGYEFIDYLMEFDRMDVQHVTPSPQKGQKKNIDRFFVYGIT